MRRTIHVIVNSDNNDLFQARETFDVIARRSRGEGGYTQNVGPVDLENVNENGLSECSGTWGPMKQCFSISGLWRMDHLWSAAMLSILYTFDFIRIQYFS